MPNGLLFDVREWPMLVDIVAVLDVDHIEDALKLKIRQRLPGIFVGAFECSSKRDECSLNNRTALAGRSCTVHLLRPSRRSFRVGGLGGIVTLTESD